MAAIDVFGKKVKAKRIGDITTVLNKDPHHKAAAKYNHLRIQCSCDVEYDLLFTDHQIKQGLYRAERNEEDLPNVSWIKRVLETEIIDTNRISDIQKIINQKKLPAAAAKYNHIRVSINNKDLNLLFTDHDIRVALERSNKNKEDIPEVNWLRDLID